MKKKVRALLIDQKAKDDIENVIKYAEAHRMTTEQLLERIETGNAVGSDENHVCNFYDGFRVVYSIEEQPNMGLCSHLSVSVSDANRLPSVPAMEMIAESFRLKKLEDGYLYVEDGPCKSINFICKHDNN